MSAVSPSCFFKREKNVEFDIVDRQHNSYKKKKSVGNEEK